MTYNTDFYVIEGKHMTILDVDILDSGRVANFWLYLYPWNRYEIL